MNDTTQETLFDLDKRVGVIEAELKHLATRADLNQLKADVEKAINTQTRWMVGAIIATASLVALITRLLA